MRTGGLSMLDPREACVCTKRALYLHMVLLPHPGSQTWLLSNTCQWICHFIPAFSLLVGLVPDSVSLLSYHLILSHSGLAVHVLTYTFYLSTLNRMFSLHFQGNPFNITVIQVYAPITNAEKSWNWTFLWRPSITYTKKDVLFIIGDWNAKVGSQEIPQVTGKFALRVQNEAEKRLTEFCQEKALVIANTLFQHYKKWLHITSPDGQHQNQIDYILSAKDGKALYSQQKQDWELTVAQIVKSLLPNSDLNWRKWTKLLDLSGMI